MASRGAPRMKPQAAPGTRVAIVASSWHTEVMDGLLAGAQRALAEAVAETTGMEVSVFRAPGSFELPLLARAAAERFDAVVALGVVAWFFVGLWLRPRVDPMNGPWFWPVSALAVLAPTAVLILVSLVS